MYSSPGRCGPTPREFLDPAGCPVPVQAGVQEARGCQGTWPKTLVPSPLWCWVYRLRFLFPPTHHLHLVLSSTEEGFPM